MALDGRLLRTDDRYHRSDCVRLLEFSLAADSPRILYMTFSKAFESSSGELGVCPGHALAYRASARGL